MSNRFPQLRQMFTQEPCMQTLDEILQWLAEWPRADDREIAVGYAREHLKNWPEHACRWFPKESNSRWEEPQIEPPDDFTELVSERIYTPEECLTSSFEEMGKKNWLHSLDWALSAWYRTHHPKVAELVESIERKLPPLVLPRQAIAHQQWMELAAQKNARWLGRLWNTVTSQCSFKQCMERISALQGWMDDPRATQEILNIIEEVPWTSNGSKVFWTKFFNIFPEISDERILDAHQRTKNWEIRPGMEETLQGKLSRAIRAIHASDKINTGKLSEQSLQIIEQSLEILSQEETTPEDSEEAALWANVYSDLTDENAKQELVNWLIEEEEVRGQFIQIQCQTKISREDKKTLKQMQESNGQNWLGDISSIVLKGETYKQGFLNKVKLKQDCSSTLEENQDNPIWATVEQVECFATDIPALIACERLNLLHTLFIKLSGTIQELQELHETLLGASFCSTLQKLVIHLGYYSGHEMQETTRENLLWAEQNCPELKELRLKTYNGAFIFKKDPDDRLGLCQLKSDHAEDAIESTIWSLPADQLSQIKLETRLSMKNVLHALRFQTRLESVHTGKESFTNDHIETSFEREDIIHIHSLNELVEYWYPNRALPFISEEELLYHDENGPEQILRIWNHRTNQHKDLHRITRDTKHQDPYRLDAFAIHPNKAECAIINFHTGQLIILNLVNGEEMELSTSLELAYGNNSLSYSPNGKWLMCCGKELGGKTKEIHFWSQSDYRTKSKQTYTTDVTKSIRWEWREDTFFYRNEHTLHSCNLTTDKVTSLQLTPQRTDFNRFVISPDEQVMAIEGSIVLFYDMETGRQVGALR